MLLQYPDDLLFRIPALLHLWSSPSHYERTPAAIGRDFRGQVTSAVRMTCAPPYCGCQPVGLICFVGIPHCARAPGATTRASASAPMIDMNLRNHAFFIDFSSSAGDRRLPQS